MTSLEYSGDSKKSETPARFILLIGPKHSGKTLVFRALHKTTGWETVDLDELIEKQTGKSPRTLYKEGAEIFKHAEADALDHLIKKYEEDKCSLIAAAGGGIADNPGAMALLSRHGEIIPVYLDVSAATAWQRILKTAGGGELPPFLNTENPRATHQELHERRAKIYKTMARLIINAEKKRPEEIAKEITDKLKRT